MAEQASTVSAVDRGMGEKGDFTHSEHQDFTA